MLSLRSDPILYVYQPHATTVIYPLRRMFIVVVPLTISSCPSPPYFMGTCVSDRVIENLRSDRQVMNTTFGSIFRLVNSYGRPPTQYITLSNTLCQDVLHPLTSPTSSRIVARYTLFHYPGAFGSVGRERDEMIISGASHIPGDSL